MRNDRRINSPGTNKAAQGGDGSFIGWSSPSKPMKCPLPDCTCVIRPDEWEEHLQLHEIESALVRLILPFFHLLDPHFLCCFEFAFSLGLQSHRLRRNLTQRQGEKERHDKREANDFDLLQRYNGGLLEEAEMYSPVDSPSLSAPSPQSSSVQKGAYVKQYIRSLERYHLCPSFSFVLSPHRSWLTVLLSFFLSLPTRSRDCGAHRLSLVEAFKKKDKLMQLMQGPDTETLTPGTVSRQHVALAFRLDQQ